MDIQRETTKKFNFLNTICNNQLPFSSRVAHYTLKDKKQSVPIEAGIVFIEYLQVAAQTIFLYSKFHDPAISEGLGSSLVVQIAKLWHPGLLFKPGEGNSQIFYIFIALMAAYTILRYTLFGYIVMCSVRSKQPYSMLLATWKWIFKLQSRIIYCVITSFWLNTVLNALEETFSIFPQNKEVSVIVFTMLIVIEFIFCLIMDQPYRFVLPRKNLLSSKDSIMETTTLCQKFTMQIVPIIMISASSYYYWICASFGIAFNLFRMMYFYMTLPNYNIKGLYLKSLLILTLASFEVSCLIQNIESVHKHDDWNHIFIAWILIFLLTAMISYGHLNKMVLRLVTTTTQTSSGLFIQRIHIIKQLTGRLKIDELENKYGYSYLVKATLATLSKMVKGTDSESMKNLTEETGPKDILRAFLRDELEDKLKKQPKDDLLKLYQAEMYMKKLNLTGLAIKSFTELQRSSNKIIAMNASLSLWKLQNSPRVESKSDDNDLNLYIYFKTQSDFVQLKTKILQQHQLQSGIYEEILETAPDLDKIFSSSQSINKYRQQIERDIKLFLSIIPDYYIEPYLFFAFYQMTLNHSRLHYWDYNKIHQKKQQRYQKEFQFNSLIPENIYQDEAAFAVVSGQKEDLGKILYCSSSVGKIYGGDPTLHTQANILSLAPLYSQGFYNLFSSTKIDKEAHDMLGHTFRAFSRHRDGYIIELDYYIDVFPFMTKGFYYCVIIRPVVMTKEYILIQETGDIAGVTQGLSKKLGLDKFPSTDLMNVQYISEDLSQANKAFNYVTLPEKYNEKTIEKGDTYVVNNRNSVFSKSTLNSSLSLLSPKSPKRKNRVKITLDTAKELYSIYTNEGKTVQLARIQLGEVSELGTNEKDNFMYDCKMTIISQHDNLVKLATLEERIYASRYAGVLEEMKLFPNEIKTTKNVQKAPISECVSEYLENSPDISLKEIEDEKTAGWIDFQALEPKIIENVTSFRNKRRIPTIISDNCNTTEGNLLSPVNSLRFKTSGQIKFPEENPQFMPKYTNMISEIAGTKDKTKTTDEPVAKAELPDASKMTRNSKTSQDERVSRAFNLALTTKYFSKPLMVLFMVFYLLLIGVIIRQVGVRSTVNTTVEDLRAKKNIITYSQNRDSSLVTTQRCVRFTMDVGTGLQYPLLNKFGFTLNTYINSLNNALKSLAKANENITLNMGSFETGIRPFLFSKDVDIFYDRENEANGTSQSLTSFQATDKIVEIGLKSVVIAKTNLSANVGPFYFLQRNSLNDLLVKTEADSALFLNSIKEQVGQCKDNIYATLIIAVILLAMMLAAIILATLKKYKEEKINLQAITRLDLEEIKSALNKLNIFKKLLEADRVNENKANIKILQPFKVKSELNNHRNYKSTKNYKAPKHHYILKKYIIVGLLAILVHGGLIALMSSDSVSFINAILYLNSEQGKLYYANGMAKLISLAYLEIYELYGSNGTTLVRNEVVSTQLQKSLIEINTMKNSVMQIFEDKNGNYDPTISKVLFGHPCSFLVNSSSTNFCGFLQNKAKTIGLISLLGDYESLITDKMQQFYASNRTTAALKAIQVTDADSILATLRVMYDQCGMISVRADTLFGGEFDNVKVRAEQALAIVIVVVIFTAWFSWIFIFRRLKEMENTFKNVLQVFSPSLVLSNFVLKSFIMRTANGTLDYVKPDIL